MTLRINPHDLDIGLLHCVSCDLYKPILKPKNKEIFLKINRTINISSRKDTTVRLFISYLLGGFNYKSEMNRPLTNYLIKQVRDKQAFIVSGTHAKGMFLFLYIENKNYITCKISTPDQFMKRIMN